MFITVSIQGPLHLLSGNEHFTKAGVLNCMGFTIKVHFPGLFLAHLSLFEDSHGELCSISMVRHPSIHPHFQT